MKRKGQTLRVIGKKSMTRKLIAALAIFCLLAGAGLLYGVNKYHENLRPVSTSTQPKTVEIASGATVRTIATTLRQQGLIRNEWAFTRYAQLTNAGRYLQAGTYEFTPSQSTQEIIGQLTHGKVATQLVTILPGKRIDQIKQSLIRQGFSEQEVDQALDPAQYESSPALVDKPKGASLEGYIYPESFQRTADTKVSSIVQQSILRLQKQLTPEVRDGFKKQGITVYQGLILASIVEKEVVKQSDKNQAAQVFLTRIKVGMPLGSDVTAFYGSELAGKGQDVTYDTPYNTRIHTGMPPTPISNVSESSLQAVAKPAATDWLFFVAGDDGTTYFSKTVAEHEALTKKYCIKLCQ
jgi:UPF0755 protein